jgi:lipopolysaccharide export LptBFGC system permease protein LptF
MTAIGAYALGVAPVAGTRRGGVPAWFGRETRHTLVAYLQRAAMVLAIGLGIILSLDAANNLGVMDSGGPGSQEGLLRLGYYLLLRAGYNLPALLPIVALVSVVWVEYRLAVSHERIMISNSGRSPALSLFPALLFGIVLGVLQFVSLAYIRPAAAAAQTAEHFRYFGLKYERPVLTGERWLTTGSVFINARVDIGDEVLLRDVTAYSLDNSGQMDAVVNAAVARPGPEPGTWTFEHGSIWNLGPDLPNGQRGMRATSFSMLLRPLALDPLWVENLEIAPSLLPQGDLLALAAKTTGVPAAFSYRAARDDRYAEVLLCVGIALLGATVSLLSFSPHITPRSAVRVGVYGGAAYVAANVLPMMGTFGVAPSFVAAWTVPVGLVGVSALLLYRDAFGVRRRLVPAVRGLSEP